jgi:alcohol dehydrogenase (NADP+)
MEKVKAYAAYGKDEPVKPFEYELKIGPNDVQVEVECTGICGSDIHTIDSGWGPTQYPVVVGHEVVGRVIARGANALPELTIGRRVGIGAMVYACRRTDCYECKNGMDNICPRATSTYNSKWRDGSPSYGGYANQIRVDSHYAFPIPDSIPSHEAAPLFCAGATCYSPLVRHGCGPGKKVAVAGLGGLGHLGVLFAKALGADVYAISHSPGKVEEAKKLGCTDVLLPADMSPPPKDASGKRPLWKWRNYFDLLLITSNATDPKYWLKLLFLLKPRGTAILVGAPEKPLSIPAFGLLGGERAIVGSSIGSRQDILDMLQLADKKKVHAWIELFAMRDVNKAIQCVRDNNVKFRAVLDVANWDKKEFGGNL